MKAHRHLVLALLLSLTLPGAKARAQTAAGAKAGPGTPNAAETPASGAASAAAASPGGSAEAAPEQAKGGQRPAIDRVLVGSPTDLGQDAQTRPAHLGAVLTVEIVNLQPLVQAARAAKKPLQLFMNGLPLQGIAPIYLVAYGKPTNLRFPLIRTDDSKETWSALLGRPRAQRRTIEVSVGVAGCAEGCTDVTDGFPIPLIVIYPAWLVGFVLVLGVGGFFLARLIRTTPMLRDHGPGSPWSLGRIQMAWWTLVVATAFVFIWMVTGSYSSLSDSVLALIGISSATGLAGAVIDDNKQAQLKQRAALEAQRANQQPAPGAAAPPSNTEIDAKLAQLPVQKQSRDLLTDILSDENGVSFHRLQIVIWTVVLTLIFVVRVYIRLDMPDFDNQLLALMGISSGTYLGFKFPEKAA